MLVFLLLSSNKLLLLLLFKNSESNPLLFSLLKRPPNKLFISGFFWVVVSSFLTFSTKFVLNREFPPLFLPWFIKSFPNNEPLFAFCLSSCSFLLIIMSDNNIFFLFLSSWVTFVGDSAILGLLFISMFSISIPCSSSSSSSSSFSLLLSTSMFSFLYILSSSLFSPFIFISLSNLITLFNKGKSDLIALFSFSFSLSFSLLLSLLSSSSSFLIWLLSVFDIIIEVAVIFGLEPPNEMLSIPLFSFFLLSILVWLPNNVNLFSSFFSSFLSFEDSLLSPKIFKVLVVLLPPGNRGLDLVSSEPKIFSVLLLFNPGNSDDDVLFIFWSICGFRPGNNEEGLLVKFISLLFFSKDRPGNNDEEDLFSLTKDFWSFLTLKKLELQEENIDFFSSGLLSGFLTSKVFGLFSTFCWLLKILKVWLSFEFLSELDIWLILFSSGFSFPFSSS